MGVSFEGKAGGSKRKSAGDLKITYARPYFANSRVAEVQDELAVPAGVLEPVDETQVQVWEEERLVDEPPVRVWVEVPLVDAPLALNAAEQPAVWFPVPLVAVPPAELQAPGVKEAPVARSAGAPLVLAAAEWSEWVLGEPAELAARAV
jgi:hypothetical protein